MIFEERISPDTVVSWYGRFSCTLGIKVIVKEAGPSLNAHLVHNAGKAHLENWPEFLAVFDYMKREDSFERVCRVLVCCR